MSKYELETLETFEPKENPTELDLIKNQATLIKNCGILISNNTMLIGRNTKLIMVTFLLNIATAATLYLILR